MGSFTQFFCVIFNAISISEYPSLSFSCGPRSHIFVYCNTSTFSTFRLLSHFNFPFFICHILSLNLRFHFSTLLNNFYIVVRRRRMEKCKKVFSVLNVVSFVKISVRNSVFHSHNTFLQLACQWKRVKKTMLIVHDILFECTKYSNSHNETSKMFNMINF